MTKRVISAGHICLDITPVFDPATQGTLGKLLSPGKLIHVEAADVHIGGSVANTGLALKKLGMDVSLVAKVGRDPFGDIIVNQLKEYGAADGLIRDGHSTTSYSVVVAPPNVDRIFLHHPGANNRFTGADISNELLKGAALLHFGYPPLMRRMYEDGGAELESLFRRAKALNVATSLDLAAVDTQSEAGQIDWAALLRRIMPYVDFFVPSAEELCFMIDRPRYDEWAARAAGRAFTDILDIQRDVAPLADRVMAWGAKIVLIKCGVPGMYCRAAEANTLKQIGANAQVNADIWSEYEKYEASFCAAQVLSGTGAGDTSIAAFLSSVLEGCDPQRCVDRALATGACCVEAYDALSGLRPLDELDRRIDSGWARVKT